MSSSFTSHLSINTNNNTNNTHIRRLLVNTLTFFNCNSFSTNRIGLTHYAQYGNLIELLGERFPLTLKPDKKELDNNKNRHNNILYDILCCGVPSVAVITVLISQLNTVIQREILYDKAAKLELQFPYSYLCLIDNTNILSHAAHKTMLDIIGECDSAAGAALFIKEYQKKRLEANSPIYPPLLYCSGFSGLVSMLVGICCNFTKERVKARQEQINLSLSSETEGKKEIANETVLTNLTASSEKISQQIDKANDASSIPTAIPESRDEAAEERVSERSNSRSDDVKSPTIIINSNSPQNRDRNCSEI
jgi:hypothetical protein